VTHEDVYVYARTAIQRGLGILLGAAALSACGARSSLLDIDTWLEDERKEKANEGGQGGQSAVPLDPAHDEPCGKALRGPLMVRIPLPDGGSFCIDSTEVSNLHYRAFIQADFPRAQQPSYCAWNDDFVPWLTVPTPADNLPVVGVDWCDARAYCAWAGKRICGKIGGGHIALGSPPEYNHADPLKEEWVYACTAGGTRTYPYGNVYDKTGCVTVDYDSDPVYLDSAIHLRPIREAKKCEGGFPGLYDMGGNATEWVDISDTVTGASDIMATFSADYATPEAFTKCVDRSANTRDGIDGGTGIRCCKDGP
jgi:formylglycine-generating enzyme required for sulfatase activity